MQLYIHVICTWSSPMQFKDIGLAAVIGVSVYPGCV